jgi:4-hydroxy-tetrahydrodipicolinate reductase
MKKRVVVWGTGVVGSMVIAEVLDHPVFELVGVGVTRSERAGQDVGPLIGLPETGILTTTSVEELIALQPDALVHYGPTAQYADENIKVMSAFLRAGIDVCSTAMTPWVWPGMKQNPGNWIDPITQACEEGAASCFTTGIDPGFANDLFPLTLMGLCGRVDSVRASELLDYTDYEGDYEDEMGIGRPPEFTPLLEIPDLLIMAWGATVPMIAHAAGIELDDITTTWE